MNIANKTVDQRSTNTLYVFENYNYDIYKKSTYIHLPY